MNAPVYNLLRYEIGTADTDLDMVRVEKDLLIYRILRRELEFKYHHHKQLLFHWFMSLSYEKLGNIYVIVETPVRDNTNDLTSYKTSLFGRCIAYRAIVEGRYVYG